MENKYDGVPDITQAAVAPGESFLYKLDFPDEGFYWYHPHIREDIQQELGLYGSIMVEPRNSTYYNIVDEEKIIILDDILLDSKDVYPFKKNSTNFAIMGRFGNTYLINGKINYSLNVKKGEVIRFFILNTANVRPFNLSFENISLKIIGSDSGKYEKEFFADSIIINPSERYIFEVLFNKSGELAIFNINPKEKNVLGKINVQDGFGEVDQLTFSKLRENKDISQSILPYIQYFNKTPDFNYTLDIEIPGSIPLDDITRSLLDKSEDGIEWTDAMPGMNKFSSSDRLTWLIKDNNTKQINMNASRYVPTSKVIKVKIYNDDQNSIHPMQHVIHIHGTRFLVLKNNDQINQNLVWKDSLLIPSGGSVELLLDFPNEGEWMMHCHIAEHLESGMMTSFKVSK